MPAREIPPAVSAPRAQHGAVRQRHRQQAPDGVATLNRFHDDGDLLSALERAARPAAVDHVRRVAGLDGPMTDRPVLLRDIELEEAVGIRPYPLRDRALHGQFFPGLERRRTVVGDERSCRREDHGRDQCCQYVLHDASPNVFRGLLAAVDRLPHFMASVRLFVQLASDAYRIGDICEDRVNVLAEAL